MLTKTVRDVVKVQLDEDRLVADLAEMILRQRKMQNKSQESVAEIAGVRKNYLSHLETGRLTLSTLMSILRVLAALDIDFCDVLQVAEVESVE